MTAIPRDQSRDVRIEDPSNLYIIHPLSRALLPIAIQRGVSANAVSIMGLMLGALSAACLAHWTDARMATIGLLLMIAWLVADGLDGMVARATGTSSALGRMLDGLCDHGVFVAVYVTLALTIGTAEGWALAFGAGAAHAVQSNFYETERARFHRRVRGDGGTARASASGSMLERIYDTVSHATESLSAPIDRALRGSGTPGALGRAYGEVAVAPMKLLALLTANVRMAAIYIACLSGDPRLFWWFEIVPLSGIVIIGLLWHRRSILVLLAHQNGRSR